MYTADQHKEVASIADLSSVADGLTFTPAFPVEIIEFGVIITTVVVGAGLTVSGDKRITAGSDTGRVAAAFGTGTFGANAAQAAGHVLRTRPTSPAVVLPGQQFIMKVTLGATSGAGQGFVVYREKPTYNDGNTKEHIVTT